jgi:hypothetical protein
MAPWTVRLNEQQFSISHISILVVSSSLVTIITRPGQVVQELGMMAKQHAPGGVGHFGNNAASSRAKKTRDKNKSSKKSLQTVSIPLERSKVKIIQALPKQKQHPMSDANRFN